MTRKVMFVVILTLLMAPSVVGQDLVLHSLPDKQGEFMVLEGSQPTSPVTVQARFSIGSRDGSAALRGMWLAGFSDQPDAPPTALSLVWSENMSGWFPTWGLQLQSDADLLPSALAPKSGEGFLQGSSYISLQQHVQPPVGHVVEALLTYDPQTGRAAVGVIDLTDDKLLFARQLTLKPNLETLYPALGIVGEDHGISVEEFTVIPYSVPIGTEWEIRAREKDSYVRLFTSRITPSYDLALRIGPDLQDRGGTFALVADDGANVTPLLSFPGKARAAEEIIAFSAIELPFGEVTIRLNYLDETGKVWELGSTPVHMVAANVRTVFEPLKIGSDGLYGTLTIASQDETLPASNLRLFASFAKPGQKDGAKQIILEQRLESISTEPKVVEFAVPVPVNAETRLFSLVFHVELDVPVAQIEVGNEYHVLWQP